MIKIEIEKQTRQVTLPNKLNPLGYDGENLQDTLEFSFTDTFVNGQARLELQYENKEKTFITLEKVEETYTIPITKIMTVEGQVYAQLVITEGTNITQPPIFKSKMFYYFVGQSINAETGDKEPYIEWIDRANAKLNQVDEALETINGKIDEIDTAIEETSNLDIDANKVDKTTTVEITKKDNTKKIVQILDGVSLQFMWQGTSLGIKTDNMQDYVFVDLQGVQGVKGDTGEPFRIKKTYSSVSEMNADFNNMEYGDYVMIASSVEIEDNAKLYTRGLSEWIFITDFSGSQGIKGETGATPIIRIGTVTSGATPSVTISGTAEEPILNFVLPKGDKGDKPIKGVDYFTQSDIDSMVAQVTEDATSEFNQNVTAKTNEFNTNATNKTTDFNNNATAKTTAFNDNATQKTNEFNTNAQDKTDEFNANKEALQEELDRYKMLENALPKVNGEGTEVTLNDTANAPMKMIPMASELEQESTSGINLMPMNRPSFSTNNVTFTNNDNNSFTLNGKKTSSIGERLTQNFNYSLVNGKTYTLAIELLGGTVSDLPTISNIAISTSGNNNYKYFSILDLATIGQKKVFSWTQNEDIDIIAYYFWVGGNAVETIYNNYKIKVWLVEGSYTSSTIPYEPYTGGNPAPNPDYPQEIHTISGDNTIIISNSIWNEQWEQGGINNNTGALETASGFIRSKNYISVKPNTTYYRTPSIEATRVFYYDINKNYISNVSVGSIGGTFATPNNAYYILFKQYVTSYNNDIAIIEGTSGVYQPSQNFPLNLPVENLFDKTNPYTDNYFDDNGVEQTSTTTGHFTNNIQVKDNTKYTMSGYKLLSGVNQANFQRVYFYDSNGNWISRTAVITTIPYTFTTPNNCKYINFQLANNVGAWPDEVYSTSLDTFQLEEGTKANSYTEFGTTPLEVCKIGNYEDEFVIPSGSNLLKGESWRKTYSNSGNPNPNDNYSTITTSDNNNIEFSVTGNYGGVESNFIPVKNNETYTISFSGTATNRFFVTQYDSSKTRISTLNVSSIIATTTFTTTSDGYIAIGFNNTTTGTFKINNIMLNKGSTALPYEPYNPDGKWYLKKNIGTYAITGNENISYNNNCFQFAASVLPTPAQASNQTMLSNNYKYNSTHSSITSALANYEFGVNTVNQLTIKDNRYSDTLTFVGFLRTQYANNTPVIVKYMLSTPTYTLLNDTLQTQLNNIRDKVLAYQDQTNVSQVNNDLPFTLKLSAIRDMSNIFELIGE